MPTNQMKASHSLSCLLLLTLGACFPPSDRREIRHPSDGINRVKMSESEGVGGHQPGFPEGAPRQKRFQDLASLFVMAKKLQGLGKERAGFRFRFGRQEVDNKATSIYLASEEKRNGLLGSLAEELSGYNRKKGGFSFRFGRR
ncbi:orexigenic neuropeptide QRFP [Phascolarctos cinereus]|uniref:Orexigenic neuropeptide QRFP n=1 Tax=Phascolarctos cinereus TaxID=38626 RepID=A0A6P5JDN4_PHACI|nr:orexigenic neuropeptide QRFP [Phascolarctos cinereus]